jgi:hypothetical protein
MVSTIASGLVIIFAILPGGPAARTPDPVGVYGMIERLQFEPPTGDPDRVQVWGVFAFADAASPDGYGPALRGYLYYTCPAGQRTACRNDWADLRWFGGLAKGVGIGLRTAPVGRLRKENEAPAAPDPYPVKGGLVKVESKDPAYVALVARLKAALAGGRDVNPVERPGPTTRPPFRAAPYLIARTLFASITYIPRP